MRIVVASLNENNSFVSSVTMHSSLYGYHLFHKFTMRANEMLSQAHSYAQLLRYMQAVKFLSGYYYSVGKTEKIFFYSLTDLASATDQPSWVLPQWTEYWMKGEQSAVVLESHHGNSPSPSNLFMTSHLLKPVLPSWGGLLIHSYRQRRTLWHYGLVQ